MSFFFFSTFLPSHFKKKNRVCHYSNCCCLSRFLVWERKTSEVPAFSTFPFDIKHQIVLIKCVFSDATTGKVTLPIIGLSLIVQHLEPKHTCVFILTLHRDTVTSPFFFLCCIFSQTCFQIVLPSKISVKKPKALKNFLCQQPAALSSSQPPTPGAVCRVVYPKREL